MATYDIPNTPQINEIQRFRSTLGKFGDLAKSARFGVQINNFRLLTADFAEDLMFLCDVAEFPGRALNVGDVRYYGPNFKLPFQSAYLEMNLSFLVRNEMLEKEFFDRWIELINPKTTYDFEYRDNYATNIDIWQFSEIEGDNGLRATYKIGLEHAYPIMVSPLSMNWAEDNFHRLQVTFTFLHWRTHQEQTLFPNTNQVSGLENANETLDTSIAAQWRARPPR